jgi:hypothetical protein
MKNRLYFTILSLFIVATATAQLNYQKGYFIDTNKEKIECLINNKDWPKIPKSFTYKVSENSKAQTISTAGISELKIYETDHFYKRLVLKDALVNRKSQVIKPKGTVVFLKVLLESDKTLYFFKEKSDFFFYEDNNDLIQLKYSERKTLDKKLKGREYQKQLHENVVCQSFDIRRYSLLKYNEKDLVNFFEEYSECMGLVATNYYSQKTKFKFDFKLNLGTNFTPSLNTKYDLELVGFSPVPSNGSEVNYTYLNIEKSFKNQLNYFLGIEAELFLPIKLNKWSLYIAPNYQYFSEVNYVFSDPNISFTRENSNFESISLQLSSIEIPLGIRRYFTINEELKLFANSGLAHNFILNSNSSIEKRADFTVTEAEELNDYKVFDSFILGIGGNYKNKYSFLINYYIKKSYRIDSDKELDANGTISFILSYKLF